MLLDGSDPNDNLQMIREEILQRLKEKWEKVDKEEIQVQLRQIPMPICYRNQSKFLAMVVEVREDALSTATEAIL